MDLTEIIHFDNTQRHPWELARYEVIKDYLQGIFVKIADDHSISVLDVGCGDAYLVHRLALDFPKIKFTGVDINFSDDLLHQLKENIKTPNLTLYKQLEELDLPKKSVDLVLLLDVIEHIEDEIAFMKLLSDYPFIHADTTFLITVPAYQKLFANHDVLLEHYRRYSNRTLRKRLLTAGYQTNFERYFFLTLIPPRMIQLIKEKLLGSNHQGASDLAAWKGGSLITSFLTNILLIDYKIGSFFKGIGINLPGLSNLVICRKSV